MQVVRVELNSGGVTDADRRYILSLCDNPDATLIIKGLTANLTPTLWTWEYLLVSTAYTDSPSLCAQVFCQWQKIRTHPCRWAHQSWDAGLYGATEQARCGHVVWKKVRVFEKQPPQPRQSSSGQDGSETDMDDVQVDADHWHERGWKTMSLQVRPRCQEFSIWT